LGEVGNCESTKSHHGKTLKPCSEKPGRCWKRHQPKRLDKVTMKGATQTPGL